VAFTQKLKVQNLLEISKDVTVPGLLDTRALGPSCIILKRLVWLFEAVVLPMSFYFGGQVTI